MSDSRPSGTSEQIPTSGGASVEVRDVVKRYENGRITALGGASLTVAEGEFVAICGPSGCGKSTMLNMLAAIDRPDSGEVVVGGRSLKTLAETEANEYRATTVGLVFQLHNLLPNLTSLENVQVPMLGVVADARDRVERARELLSRVGLSERERARPGTLSGGERQRVAVARALANAPRLLLADEPTGALDSKSSDQLFDLLSELQESLGTTLLVVTHDAHVAERAGRLVEMLDGRIVG